MQEANIVIDSIGQLEYGGLFMLALAANIIIPVPEEVLLLIAGYFTGVGIFKYLYVCFIFILGMFLSDIVLFYLARRGSNLINGLKKKIKNKYLARDEDFVKNHVKKIIFVSRFLVYIRFIGPVLSGSVKTKWSTFLFYNFIALCIYVPLVLFLGSYFHENISRIISGVARGKNYILLAFVIILIYIISKYINKSFIKKLAGKIGEYVPTIIPGLSVKEKDKTKEDQESSHTPKT